MAEQGRPTQPIGWQKWIVFNMYLPLNILSSNRSVPLFGKEGLGEILLDKSPFFKGGGERLPSYRKLLILRAVTDAEFISC